MTLGFGFLIALDAPPLDLRSSPLLVPIAQAMVVTPLVVRMILPVLRSADDRLRQAAAVLGAAPVRAWAGVDLPIMGRALVGATAFAFAMALGEFGATSFVARPETITLPVMIGRLIDRPGPVNTGMALAARHRAGGDLCSGRGGHRPVGDPRSSRQMPVAAGSGHSERADAHPTSPSATPV